MSKNVGTIEYTIDAKTDKLLIAGRQADDSFDIIERGAKKADSSIKTLNKQSKITKTNIIDLNKRKMRNVRHWQTKGRQPLNANA
ncbi:TPA: hypothetical protein ACF929_001510 [Escherichia coli]